MRMIGDLFDPNCDLETLAGGEYLIDNTYQSNYLRSIFSNANFDKNDFEYTVELTDIV
jgi:hypothetical protein